MKQSLTKLVDVILEKMADQAEGGHSVSGIRSWLLRQGYAKHDIDAALNLVDPRVDRSISPQVGPASVRHLSEIESYRLSPEARYALVRLDIYELIDPYERELLLERLDQIEGEVALSDLEYLITWLICPTRDVEHQQTLFSVLDGARGTVH